jgi:uridine kinase
MAAVLEQSDVDCHRQIISLSQDSFYRELTEDNLKLAKKGHFNFDHPGSAAMRHIHYRIYVCMHMICI